MHPKFDQTRVQTHDLQYSKFSCHWDACSTLTKMYCHFILDDWGDFKCTGSHTDVLATDPFFYFYFLKLNHESIFHCHWDSCCSNHSVISDYKKIFLVQVRLRIDVPRIRSSTQPGFELTTSRPWQYISCHWPTCSNHSVISDYKKIFFVQVQLKKEVLRTPSSTQPRFKLITSRSWQYISCHWELDVCSNHSAISDLKEMYFHFILQTWSDFSCTHGSPTDALAIDIFGSSMT